MLGKTTITPSRYSDLFFTLEELGKFYTYVGNIQRSIGNEPNWTQWYVPSCKDFDLIFDACGGTKYSSATHVDNQQWSFGNLDGMLIDTEPGACGPQECMFGYVYPFYPWAM